MKKAKKTICIIGGRGVMGGFFADVLKHDFEIEIIDRDNADALAGALEKAEIVIISVPLPVTNDVVKDLCDKVTSRHMIVNFASIMGPSLEVMKKVPCESVFVHPLFAPSKPDIKNLKFVVASINKGEQLHLITDFLRRNGGVVSEMRANEHDRLMATIQALTHLVNFLLAETIGSSRIAPEKLKENATA
ncbi:MAG TPA: prephenate dehydrogenase/arogenate dehydrogenase family protein, partial [bacterium]|nr:prephenate dehydrogenase/arogenate dehydrogenase family protein [bacterium]